MSSDNSDDEPLSNIASLKRRQPDDELQIEIVPIKKKKPKPLKPKKKKSTKKFSDVTIELRPCSPPVVERPADVWMYLKDLNSSGPYSCLLCSEWFINKNKIMVHYIVNHKKNFCGICRYLVTDEAWNAHQKFHKPWSCSQCTQTFDEFTDFQTHFSDKHNLIHCRLCHTQVPGNNEYDTHLFQKHSVTNVAQKDEELFWQFEDDNYEKFKCILCSKPNNPIRQFSNHYISFHHITLKCFSPLLAGKDLKFKVMGAELTPQFIERELTAFGKFGYVDLETTEKIENAESENKGFLNENEYSVKIEVMEIEEITTSQNVVPVNDINPDQVENIPSNYKGDDDFDITLMELIVIQKCYYHYLNKSLKEVKSKTMPINSNINYETALTDTLLDIDCSLCPEKFTTRNIFISHMIKMHCVKTLPTFSCRVCATVFDSLNELSQHISQELGEFEDLWICQYCDKEFDNREMTREHLTEHWSVIDKGNCFSPHLGFKCRYCPYLFWNEDDREVHHVKTHFDKFKEDFYKCGSCDELFSDKIWFTHHFIQSHQTSQSPPALYILKCCICCLVLPTVEDMRIHFELNHQEARKVYCSLGTCKHKPFSHKKSFQLHLRAFHTHPRRRGDGRSRCGVCDLQFASARACAAHAAQAHRLTCTLCRDTLATLDERKIHYLIRHPGRHPFQCDDCDKSFRYKSSLYLHKQEHAPHKHNFTCNYCGKVFKKRDSFREHVAIHAGPRHACSYCPAVFVQRSNMLRHERRHTGERPYACHACPRTFADKGAATSHARTHQKDPSFSCMYCGQTFVQKSKLTYHIRKHTGENLETCTVCSKIFTSGCALREHMKVHQKKPKTENTAKCPICDKWYLDEKVMMKHIRAAHTSAKHGCPICRKKLKSPVSLREHVLTHSETKTFKCKMCPKSYNVKRTMIRHLRRRHDFNISDEAIIKEYFMRLDPRDCNLNLDDETMNTIFGPPKRKMNDVLVSDYVTISKNIEINLPKNTEMGDKDSNSDKSSDESENDIQVEVEAVQIKEEPEEEPEQNLEPTDFVSVKIEYTDESEMP